MSCAAGHRRMRPALPALDATLIDHSRKASCTSAVLCSVWSVRSRARNRTAIWCSSRVHEGRHRVEGVGVAALPTLQQIGDIRLRRGRLHD